MLRPVALWRYNGVIRIGPEAEHPHTSGTRLHLGQGAGKMLVAIAQLQERRAGLCRQAGQPVTRKHAVLERQIEAALHRIELAVQIADRDLEIVLNGVQVAAAAGEDVIQQLAAIVAARLRSRAAWPKSNRCRACR